MDFLIKSPVVARRVRGRGGLYYVLDAGTDGEKIVNNACGFRRLGLDFDAMCQAGRISVCNGSSAMKTVSNSGFRNMVRHEIRRRINSMPE